MACGEASCALYTSMFLPRGEGLSAFARRQYTESVSRMWRFCAVRHLRAWVRLHARSCVCSGASAFCRAHEVCSAR
eukprot:6179968-Pleurochrysis_carterae.AAC.3